VHGWLKSVIVRVIYLIRILRMASKKINTDISTEQARTRIPNSYSSLCATEVQIISITKSIFYGLTLRYNLQ
jgi:hypothetical protein